MGLGCRFHPTGLCGLTPLLRGRGPDSLLWLLPQIFQSLLPCRFPPSPHPNSMVSLGLLHAPRRSQVLSPYALGARRDSPRPTPPPVSLGLLVCSTAFLQRQGEAPSPITAQPGGACRGSDPRGAATEPRGWGGGGPRPRAPGFSSYLAPLALAPAPPQALAGS